MLARFVASFAFSFIVVWFYELLPTTVRSIGVGLVNGVAFGGVSLAPFMI